VWILVGRLKHPPNFYRLNVFIDKVLLRLTDFFFVGFVTWTGVVITHKILEIIVQPNHEVKIWGINLFKIRKILKNDYFILLHVYDNKQQDIEILILKKIANQVVSTVSLYPVQQLSQMQSELHK